MVKIAWDWWMMFLIFLNDTWYYLIISAILGAPLQRRYHLHWVPGRLWYLAISSARPNMRDLLDLTTIKSVTIKWRVECWWWWWSTMRNGAFYNFHHIEPGHGTSRRAGFSYMFPSAGGMFDCHAADGAVQSPAVDQKPSAFPKVFMVVQSCHELFEFEQQGFCMVLSHGLLFQVIPGRNNQDKSTADWGGLSTTWNAGVKQWVEFLNGNVSRGDVRGNHHLLLHDQVIIGLRQNLSAYTFWNYMGIRRDVV